MLKFKVLLFAVFSMVFGFAQQAKIDSLYQIIHTTKNDSTKVAVYNQIVWKYLFSDKVKAKELLDTSEKIALATNQKFGYNSVLGIKGIYYDVNGNSDSAKYFFEKSLEYSKKNKFLVHEEHTLNNLGMYNWNQGNFEKALQYYFESIKVNQKIPEEKRGNLDANYNNIGLIYQEMHLFDKAITYHLKALELRKKRKYISAQIHSYNNLGICYKELDQMQKAKASFEESIVLAKQINPGNEYYTAIEGLASIEYKEGNYKKALDLFLQSLHRPKEVPLNSKEKVHLYSNLAAVYVNIKQPKEAIRYGELCLSELELSSENKEYEVEVYKSLAEAYYLIGNIEKGSFYNAEFYKKTTEKFKEESAKSFQELEVKYETEKKEKDLAQEKVKVAERELRIKNKNNLLLISGFVILSILLISWLFLSQQKFKNKQLQKEKELSEALLKIESNNRLQEQRLAISRDLHDNIGAQLTFIISSIDSLKMFLTNGEEKVVQKLSNISQFTKETITELRDTIWAMNKDEILVEDFKTRISNFIEQAKVSLQGISFEFTCHLPKETSFNSKDGMNIYRIIQESVNNAIKHAKATKIEVVVSKSNQQIEVIVKDNGNGFDIENSSFGNGLNSIKKRALESNCELKIESNSSGTTVSLMY
jgi:signal transduction histidine kinase/tetratricopeptide (TPR) repeat protein